MLINYNIYRGWWCEKVQESFDYPKPDLVYRLNMPNLLLVINRVRRVGILPILSKNLINVTLT